MLFISIVFPIFLTIFFAFYWLLQKHLRWQNLLVIAGSYIFYGWADWRYTFLLAGFTLVSFFSGLLLESADNEKKRKIILWSVVVVNVGILTLYKYYDFFIGNFNRAFAALGFTADWATLNLVLPIGISFYTFQALSYTIDVYHRRIRPTHDPISFFAFLSFFPQMVAGPIERADKLLPQFERQRQFSYPSAVSGMKRILWGLVKKMVIADNCAQFVNYSFLHADSLGWPNLWIGAFFCTLQIYGDFSGYSDIAVGCGRLLGINLTENFRFPFFAHGVKDLWRRWHITLTSWLHDYVYIPLGGNRRGLKFTIINILIVFLLSGIWHGAEWSYVAWGVYHGVLMGMALLIPLVAAKMSVHSLNRKTHPKAGKILNGVEIFYTFLLFMIGVVMFRSHSVAGGLSYIYRMFSFQGRFTEFQQLDCFGLTVTFVVIFIVTEWFGRKRECPIIFPDRGLFSYPVIRWGFYYLLTVFTLLFRGVEAPFIYFQF